MANVEVIEIRTSSTIQKYKINRSPIGNRYINIGHLPHCKTLIRGKSLPKLTNKKAAARWQRLYADMAVGREESVSRMSRHGLAIPRNTKRCQ